MEAAYDGMHASQERKLKVIDKEKAVTSLTGVDAGLARSRP